MAITNSLSKPGGPAPILNGGSPQAKGLVYWAPLGMPGAVQDQVQRHTTPWLVGTSLVQTPYGAAWKCDANLLGGFAPAPAALQGLLPVTLMFVCWQQAAPVTDAAYFGVTFAATDLTPFHQYKVVALSTSTVGLAWNNAGSQVVGTAVTFPAVGALHVCIGVIANGRQQLYLDGVSVASQANAIASVSSSNGNIGIGQQTSDITTRHAGAYFLDCRIYNRAITDDEARSYTDQWTDLYYQPGLRFTKKRATGTLFISSLTGGLSFSGARATQTIKAATGAVSFSGTAVKATAHQTTAALSFSGTTTKRSTRFLTGTLGFVGALTPSRLFTLALTATLAFVGAVSRSTQKRMTGTLSATGAVTKVTARALAGALSFTGAVSRLTAKAVSGNLTLSGTVAKRTAHSLAAVLGLAGVVAKMTGHPLAAAVSFVGSFVAVFSGGGSGHLYTLALTATLGFAGVIGRQTRRGFTATLGTSSTGIGPSIILVGNRLATRISAFFYSFLD